MNWDEAKKIAYSSFISHMWTPLCTKTALPKRRERESTLAGGGRRRGAVAGARLAGAHCGRLAGDSCGRREPAAEAHYGRLAGSGSGGLQSAGQRQDDGRRQSAGQRRLQSDSPCRSCPGARPARTAAPWDAARHGRGSLRLGHRIHRACLHRKFGVSGQRRKKERP
jgi:hypothetical protein